MEDEAGETSERQQLTGELEHTHEELRVPG